MWTCMGESWWVGWFGWFGRCLFGLVGGVYAEDWRPGPLRCASHGATHASFNPWFPSSAGGIQVSGSRRYQDGSPRHFSTWLACQSFLPCNSAHHLQKGQSGYTDKGGPDLDSSCPSFPLVCNTVVYRYPYSLPLLFGTVLFSKSRICP